jgi:diguanylate cyclase (GGDEF)-like protein
VLACTTAFAQDNLESIIDHAEQLGWVDPQAALSQLSDLPSAPRTDASLVELLTVRGLLYVDNRQDGDAHAVIERLRSMGQGGVSSAGLAAHLVRAYSLSQNDQFDSARTELGFFKDDANASGPARFRAQLLRGTVLLYLGQPESALQAYEKALDSAEALSSAPRQLRVMRKRTQLFIGAGNLPKATAQLAAARELASATHNESALVLISQDEADVADHRGDRLAERRASLEALVHAERVGSAQLRAIALANIADSYLKTGDNATSLHYSMKALAAARGLRRFGLEQTIRFNIGLANLASGNALTGKRFAEAAIQETIAGSNYLDADGFLREFGAALAHAGDWHAATDVYVRETELRDRLMTIDRQRALLALSAKFDDERQAREIELLKRGNAIKDIQLGAQRARQAMILTLAILSAVIGAVLGWAFTRVRRANAKLRYASEHDALTGLHNRRYFNENVLMWSRNTSFLGTVILIDLDHFKQVNDTFGHPAGDAVLLAVGKRLSAAMRTSDTLIRWGGEEFLAVLQPMNELEARATAQRLLNTVRREPVPWNGDAIPCTISIGYANCGVIGARTEISLDRAISLVDKALYNAKRRGRDRACLISHVHARSEEDLIAINTEFEAAALDRRIELVETVGTAS